MMRVLERVRVLSIGPFRFVFCQLPNHQSTLPSDESFRIRMYLAHRTAGLDIVQKPLAFSGTRGFEEPFAKTAVCARDGLPEECLGRSPKEPQR
jgi:hypothetical protein